MKPIHTVGIVGAGTMGSALAQKFAQENFNIFLADTTMNVVQAGLEKIKKSLLEGVNRKVFSGLRMNEILGNIHGTANLHELKNCELVIEAIYEDFNAKAELFSSLDKILEQDTIIATNTSSYSVTELSKFVSQPERFIGLHFFYHAAKNRLVEIICGEKTSEKTFKKIKNFSIHAGKDAILCRDAYGFAVNRFFVPWLNEAVRLHEENMATTEEIDALCMDIFGIAMGPFALMNATGVPIAEHAAKTLEIFGNLYAVSDSLKKQAASKKEWNIQSDRHITAATVAGVIKERMLGTVFFICSQILDEKICSAADLNRGAKIGLKWKNGPIEMMRHAGEKMALQLIRKTAERYKMKMPTSVGESYWEMAFVKLEKNNSVAVITISQPENMNALHEEMFRQLNEKLDDANNDNTIDTIFITGSGKAFVAGADIKFFVKNIRENNLRNIEAFTKFGQQVFEKIDHSPKKVIAVVNGLALGGGLELALCADAIMALPNAQFSFPETGIGIYPGLGGTQRCTEKIGKGLTKYLIHTGRTLNATDAFEIGLVDEIIRVEEMFELLSGTREISLPVKFTLPERWKGIRNFFENHSLNNILERTHDGKIAGEDFEKLWKSIKNKAPVALQLADKLIEERKGCESELKHLREIFSTSDALLGLSSIGQNVEFKGR